MLYGGGRLCYYDTPGGRYINEVNLEGSQVVIPPSSRKPHCFHIFALHRGFGTSNKRSKYVLCANNDAEMQTWVDALRKVSAQWILTQRSGLTLQPGASLSVGPGPIAAPSAGGASAGPGASSAGSPPPTPSTPRSPSLARAQSPRMQKRGFSMFLVFGGRGGYCVCDLDSNH